MDRRTFVVGASAVGAVGVAGYVGGYIDLGSDDGPDEPSTDTTPEEPGSDDGAELPSADTTPEAVTESFFEAFAAGDQERQAELLHEDVAGGVSTTEAGDLTINEIEPRTIAEIAEQDDQSITEDELENIQQNIQELTADIGATDSTHVYFDYETDAHGSADGYLFVVENDGAWRIYSRGIDVEQAAAQGATQTASG